MAVSSTWGFAVVGVDALPVRVEAHARSGLPGVTIVGLPGAAVREARERIRSAAASSGVPLPTRRITVNLSPGDIPKEGPGFDLPVALCTLAACGYLSADRISHVGAVGELSLEGVVRPTRGVISATETARRLGLALLVVAVEALPFTSVVDGVTVVGVRSLGEAVAVLNDEGCLHRLVTRGERWAHLHEKRSVTEPATGLDLEQVYGHHQAKRALEVAAAGGHHLLMMGPPGSGKTMLARRLTSILPPLDKEEALEVTRVWDSAGLGVVGRGSVRTRPVRAPHHTASRAALVGGGAVLRPGEISLAHHGVLFMDELPEFSRDALEALRQPLEEGRIVISRRTGTSEFPAACTFVGAMNPCPCGYLGHEKRTCTCTAAGIVRYRARVSGPLLDRIDVLIEVPPLTVESLHDDGLSEPSAVVAARVAAARGFAQERTRSIRPKGSASLEDCACMTQKARGLLRAALASDCLGGRGYARVIRLARTIADLDGTSSVSAEHVGEALALRLDHRSLGALL